MCVSLVWFVCLCVCGISSINRSIRLLITTGSKIVHYGEMRHISLALFLKYSFAIFLIGHGIDDILAENSSDSPKSAKDGGVLTLTALDFQDAIKEHQYLLVEFCTYFGFCSLSLTLTDSPPTPLLMIISERLIKIIDDHHYITHAGVQCIVFQLLMMIDEIWDDHIYCNLLSFMKEHHLNWCWLSMNIYFDDWRSFQLCKINFIF